MLAHTTHTQRLTPSTLRSQTTTQKRFIFHKNPYPNQCGWPHVTSHEMDPQCFDEPRNCANKPRSGFILAEGRVSCGKRTRQVLPALLPLLLHAAAAAAAAAAASGGARADAARLDGRWGAASRTNAS